MVRTLLLAAALLAAAPAGAQIAAPEPVRGTRLDVVATGEVTRVPDVVVIQTGITTQAATASEAIRQNGARMDAMRAALRQAGVAERDIQTSSVQLNAEWRHRPDQEPVFAGYRASHMLTVRFRDAANSGRILDALVAAGANEINGPSFEVADAAAALDEARARALETARTRAELYARSLGMRVVRIISVSEGGPMRGPIVGRLAARDVSAQTNIVLGEESLGATLNVSFELE